MSLTVQVLSVADVLEVTARVLPAQLRLRPVGLEPGVVVPPVFGARRHAARRCIPHGVYVSFRLYSPKPENKLYLTQSSTDRACLAFTTGEEKTGR